MLTGAGTGGGGARLRTSRRRGDTGARRRGLQAEGAEGPRLLGDVGGAGGERLRGLQLLPLLLLLLQLLPPLRRADSWRATAPCPDLIPGSASSSSIANRRAASQVSFTSLYVAGGSSPQCQVLKTAFSLQRPPRICRGLVRVWIASTPPLIPKTPAQIAPHLFAWNGYPHS